MTGRFERLRASCGERAVLVVYSAGWSALRVLPGGWSAGLFRFAADLAVRRNGPGVRRLRRNLARMVPSGDLELTVRAGMRSYARYWLETFRLPALDVHDVVSRVRADGEAHLDAGLAAGRGVILALPHSGNWEVSGLWLVARGQPFVTVAERLRPEALYDRFVEYRESLGMTVLPLTGPVEGGTTTRVMLEKLRSGGVVCLVADRDLSRRGVEVDFFGERTSMPPGPAQLALATGAALLPVHAYFEPDGWGHSIGPPIEFGDGDRTARVRQGTQALADSFQDRIAGRPEDWHMLQPLWIADRS